MARLISIDIEFNNKTYFALVSVRQKEEGFACQVRYADSSLQHILAGDQLVLDQHGGLKHPGTPPTGKARLLIDNTIKIISRHLCIV